MIKQTYCTKIETTEQKLKRKNTLQPPKKFYLETFAWLPPTRYLAIFPSIQAFQFKASSKSAERSSSAQGSVRM